jgi:type IV secretion system protein VirB5
MNPFRRPNDHYGSSAPVETPYQRASQNGTAASALRHPGPQLAADGLRRLGRRGSAVGGLIYQGSNTRIATYVVPIDKYGRPGRTRWPGAYTLLRRVGYFPPTG